MNELITVTGGTVVLSEVASQDIAGFEKTIKQLKAAEDELKKAILEEMEQKGIIKVETPELTINYIAPHDKETFDSKAFRSDNPTLYDDYVRMSPVKSSVRIKVK